MTQIVLILSVLIVSNSSWASDSRASDSRAIKKLLILGDSITEGYGVAKNLAYPALLEKKLHAAGKKDWQVINAGVSGSTTASALSRLKWHFKTKPEVLLLVLGANDGLRGLKIDDSKNNLAVAIEFAHHQKVRVILGGLYMPPNYGPEYTTKFKGMFLALAKKYQVTFIPFVLEKVGGNPKFNQADGIHPNEQGHRIIAANLFEVLKGVL
jgi:acyl-CoA thioesterase-1